MGDYILIAAVIFPKAVGYDSKLFEAQLFVKAESRVICSYHRIEL